MRELISWEDTKLLSNVDQAAGAKSCRVHSLVQMKVELNANNAGLACLLSRCSHQTHSLLSRLYQTRVCLIQLLTQQQWRAHVPVACKGALGIKNVLGRECNTTTNPTYAYITPPTLTSHLLRSSYAYVTIAALRIDLENM